MSRPTLHGFQLNLVDRVRAARSRGARIIVVQGATGCGKTTFASHMVELALAKESRVLAMVHMRKLVGQISERLLEFQIEHGVLMAGEKPDPRFRVQVASRDTLLSRCVNNGWIGMPPADLIIVDEGHHAANPESEYRRILEQYPLATILLLSATPVGPDGKGLGPWAQAIECAAPMSELIRDGFLVPLKCYAPERKVKNGRARRGIAGDLVESWKQYSDNQPTVLFCSRVQYSLESVEAFKAEGISAAHIDADTPDDERDLIFSEVEQGKIKVVSNVGIIAEGVDVPCLGCCQFYMDPSGRVGFLQRVGRIMRRFLGNQYLPAKKYGILIDHAGAVFRHGFPDEDTEWTLEGNVDQEFSKKHKDGLTEKAHYCKHCERMYHGQLDCPGCGRQPSKPPRSIFSAPPLEHTSEILTEAERGGNRGIYAEEEKIAHWKRCLGVAANRNGTFSMARVIYKQKYGEYPGESFPCNSSNWKAKVTDVFPGFSRRKRS